MLIKLTNDGSQQYEFYLNASYIVSVKPNGNGAIIKDSKGDEYRVKDNPDEIYALAQEELPIPHKWA